AEQPVDAACTDADIQHADRRTAGDRAAGGFRQQVRKPVQVVGPTRYGRAQCAVGQVPVGDAVVAAEDRAVEFAHRGGIAEVDAGLTTGRGEQMVRQGRAGSDQAGEVVPALV